MEQEYVVDLLVFIANLRCSTQCDDVTAVQYKSVLHGCIARMYPCAYGTFTAEAENSPQCDRHSGSTQYGRLHYPHHRSKHSLCH